MNFQRNYALALNLWNDIFLDVKFHIGLLIGLIFIAISTIYASKAIYNIFFHPCAKYPGPFLAKISPLWYARLWMSGNWPFKITDLHKYYGDVIRIAPNTLSFATAQSFKEIYGNSKTPFVKSDFYRRSKESSVFTERDPTKHRLLKKTLAPGFSPKALRSQSDIVQSYVDLFIGQLGRLGNSPEGVNLEDWFIWITFDIIGDLTFGESFGAVENARSHQWVEATLESTYYNSLTDIFRKLPILKFFSYLYLPSGLKAARKLFCDFSLQKIRARMKKPNDRADFFGHILADKENQVSEAFLLSQANTLMVGGSETTSTALTALAYYLLKHPEKFDKLKTEIRETFKTYDAIDGDSTMSLVYLSGCIEEALRLFPPAPHGWERVSPGANVNGDFIAQGTLVSTPPWTVYRDDRYWHRPTEFHPERWIMTDPDRDHGFDRDVHEAVHGFSLGSRACLGINLAYLEMRTIISKMVWKYDWVLVNPTVDLERDSKMLFLWKKPKILVRFLPR